MKRRLERIADAVSWEYLKGFDMSPKEIKIQWTHEKQNNLTAAFAHFLFENI